MKINFTKASDEIKVAIEGRLDTPSAAQCEQEFQKLKEYADQTILVDCTAMEYVSSSGLRLFLSLLKEVEAKGGKLILEHLNNEVRDVFTLTGFFKLFDIRS